MAQEIAYSTNSLPNTVKKGNFALAINDVAYNDVSGTEFYAGIDPPDGGYTIYVNKASNGPSIFTTSTEAELINITRELSGTTYSNTQECLQWFSTQNDKLVVASTDNYKNIVTSGSVLNLDASVLGSYPITGSTWYDLSDDNNNGLLINGPILNNGAFEFDGTDDYIQTTSLTTPATGAFTVGFIYQLFSSGDRGGLFERKILAPYNGFSLGQGSGGIWNFVMSDNFDSGRLQTSFTYPNLNTWYYDVGVFDGYDSIQAYRNGALVDTDSGYVVGNLDTGGTRDPLKILNRDNNSNNMEGKCALVQVYDRALTPQEIKQNYFQAPIVTDGLVFALDAGNLVSYESGSTTATSLTGSINTTLNNGTGFTKNNGSSWEFDGTNDQINCGNQVGGGYIDITAEVWVYPERESNYFFARYIPGTNGWIILSGVLGGLRSFGVHGREQGGSGNYFANNATNVYPDNNVWYHLCFTKQANNWRLYVNGNLEANNIVGTGTIPFSSPGSDTLDLGYLSGDAYTQGKISTARIYNRALTPQEVLQNFNAQRKRFGL